jgi:peptidoglycan/LPS O-acetylase OafA/YrhL
MRITYRRDIDGLRAVAVLAVLGYHAFPEMVSGGFVGVDIFFVISGFLITSILAAELQDHSWSLRGFYARRILRIFPALLLVLVATLWLGWYVLLANEYKPLGKHAAAGAGFVANFAYWFEAGYFDRASELKPLLHLWSLGIEEQFYIAWPLALWALWRFGRRPDRYAAALLGASLIYACVLVWLDRTQAFYSPLTRAWELLAGAWLALRQARNERLPSFLQKPAAQWGADACWACVQILFFRVRGLCCRYCLRRY